MSQSVQNTAAGGSYVPRGSAPESHKVVAVFLLVSLAFSPIAMLSAAAVYLLVLSQVRYSWRLVAGTAAALFVVVWLVLWPLTGGGLVWHFGWYGAVADGAWLDALRRALPLSLPWGAFCGAVAVGLVERGTGRAEWHPLEQRRRLEEVAAQDRAVRDLLADERIEELGERTPIGVVWEGEAGAWRDARFAELATLPVDHRGSMAVLGAPGSGKTETLIRLVRVWAKQGKRIVFGDFKGTDPGLVARLIAVYRSVVPDAVFAVWPAQPLDIWRGERSDIVEKLLQVHDYSEPYYEDAAKTLVWFAVHSPDGPPRDSDEFMRRLDPAYLQQAYAQDKQALKQLAAVLGDKAATNGVIMRFAGFFRAMAGRLDGGFSFEDADLIVLRVPWASPRDAMAVARMVLVDYASYAVSRKSRDDESVLIIDEFSAVSGAASFAISSAERLRDVNAQLVLSGQGWGGMGKDDDERRRLVESLGGGLIIHRLIDPEKLVMFGGTVRAVAATSQLSDTGPTGLGSAGVGFRMRISPDSVREAPVGRAWIIYGGKSLMISVIVVRPGEDDERFGESLYAYATQAERDMAEGRAVEPAEWWDRRLPGGWRPMLPPVPSWPELPGSGGPSPLLPPGVEAWPSVPEAVPVPVGPPMRVLLGIESLVRRGLVESARGRAMALDEPGWSGAEYVAEVVERRREMRRALEHDHGALGRRVRG